MPERSYQEVGGGGNRIIKSPEYINFHVTHSLALNRDPEFNRSRPIILLVHAQLPSLGPLHRPIGCNLTSSNTFLYNTLPSSLHNSFKHFITPVPPPPQLFTHANITANKMSFHLPPQILASPALSILLPLTTGTLIGYTTRRTLPPLLPPSTPH